MNARVKRIREQYVDVLEAIAEQFGRVPGDHVIPVNASFARCIDYACRYLHEGDSVRDYRFNRYRRALARLLDEFDGHLDRNAEATIHIDVGCGPGLFSWAAHDHFLDRQGARSLELYGFDHCPAMTRLAEAIWRRLDTQLDASLTHNAEELMSDVWQGGPKANAIVSFGHVLIQAGDDPTAIRTFSDFLAQPNLLVVAVDAKHGAATFGRACDSLRDALWRQHGLEMDMKVLPESRMVGVVGGQKWTSPTSSTA